MKFSVPLQKVIQALEEWAPRDTAQDWDNVGLQIGDPSAPISSVLVSLDVDAAVLRRLDEKPFDLIYTHHPLFYRPLKRIDYTTDMGKVLTQFLSKGIHLYSAHTNLDVAEGGVGDCLVAEYGLDPAKATVFCDGLGKLFKQAQGWTVSHFLKQKPGRLVGLTEEDRPIRKVAFCPGSGKGLLPYCQSRGVDLFVTGELSYHDEVYCELNEMSAILLGHKASETAVLPAVKTFLDDRFLGLIVEVI